VASLVRVSRTRNRELRVTEFDAQAGRLVSSHADVSRAQVTSDEVDLADGLQGLAALVAGGLSLDDLLAAVAGFAAQAIPGVDGVGVTSTGPKGTTMGIAAWAVTAPFVRQIDVLQYETLQEGPCITCMQDRVVVISGSLGGDRRWPRFGGRVARLGVASSLSLPLLIADQVVGSLNCYAYATDAFGEHAVRLGTLFASPAAVSVYNARVITEAQNTAAQLQRALVSRTVIDQAIGIIRARSGGTAEDAFERLRQISQTENTKLHEVARRIVEEAVRRARARQEDRPDPAP
jgi:GAF domain-containing protein